MVSARTVTRSLFVAFSLVAFASGARGQVIDFENTPGSGNATYSTLDVGAFRFTAGHFHIIDVFTPSGGIAQNGSGAVLGAEGAGAGSSTVTMTRIDGASFDLSGFDVAEMWLSPPSGYPNASSVRVTATTVGGTPLSTTFPLDGLLDGPGGVDDYQTFLLAGYANVPSVTFEALSAGVPDFGFALDNINLAPSGCYLPYGAGCPGTGGFVPQLTGTGCVTAGGPINLSITKGLGGSTAVLFLGASQISVPIGLSPCSLLVGPPQLPLTIGLSGLGAGAGSIQLIGSLPPGSTGAMFTLQAFVADPLPGHGFTTSAGLQITVQ